MNLAGAPNSDKEGPTATRESHFKFRIWSVFSLCRHVILLFRLRVSKDIEILGRIQISSNVWSTLTRLQNEMQTFNRKVKIFHIPKRACDRWLKTFI